MKKINLIPNAITAFGLVCGLFAIFRTSIGGPNSDLYALIQASALLILFAAFADLVDGAVARWIKAESEFGGYFDSLADAVNFGVAPPILVLKSLALEGTLRGSWPAICIIIAAMIYTLCGVLRLVRFNIRSKEAKEAALRGDEQLLIAEKKHFTGLPIPAAAAAAVSACLLLISPYFLSWFSLSTPMRALIMSLVLVILGYFMISRWKFPSVKALHLKVPSFYLVFAMGIGAVLILYGILEFFSLAFFALSWLYLLVAWLLSLIRLIAGKRSKTLEDFEPDDDNDSEE